MASEPDGKATIEAQPEIVPEATAKRRLAIYTLARVAGFAAIFGGVALAQGGKGLGSAIFSAALLSIGVASLFLRPRSLGRAFGSRW